MTSYQRGVRANATAMLVLVLLTVAACGSGVPSVSPVASAPPSRASQATTAPTPTASAAGTTSPYASPAGPATLAWPKRTAFVQLFEWRWADVARECEQWLGPRGFAAVQISPPQEHALIDDGTNHFPWWERYQAVSYRLESRSGTRAEFAAMVKRCRAAGVEIYADVLLNHMAAGQGTGSAGTIYTKYTYPGLYGATDFHANPNPAYPVRCDHGIKVESDPLEVQTCELSGLADLRTEEPKVQQALAAYLADLYGLGVRGFRIDAAKHIAAPQLAAILGRLRAKLPPDATFFVDQEVTDLGADAIPKSDYYATGSVEDFVFSQVVGDAFLRADQNLASLKDLAGVDGMGRRDRSVTFLDNHDIQRGRIAKGLVLTYKREDLYILANTFLLTTPFGYPRIMSSYVFSDTEAGPPSDAAGHTDAIYAAGSSAPNCGLEPGQWVCEQRWHAIAGMVGFRNFTADEPAMTDWWSNAEQPNQIAFGRGTAGFLVINRTTLPLSQLLHTSLAAGTYCDVISGDLAADARTCTGAAVGIREDGMGTFDVPPMQAVAIHVGARVGAR